VLGGNSVIPNPQVFKNDNNDEENYTLFISLSKAVISPFSNALFKSNDQNSLCHLEIKCGNTNTNSNTNTNTNDIISILILISLSILILLIILILILILILLRYGTKNIKSMSFEIKFRIKLSLRMGRVLFPPIIEKKKVFGD
jgi:hypothetical protein